MSLKNELDTFGNIFKHRLRTSEKLTFRWVTCKNVDWKNKSMNGLGDDDILIPDILLGLSYAVKPTVGTDCLIAVVEGADRFATTSFLVIAGEAEQIELRGGNNGGLANTPELKTQLEKLSRRVDGIIDALNSPSVVATPQDGGSALLTLLRAELKKITAKESFENIEDTTITH